MPGHEDITHYKGPNNYVADTTSVDAYASMICGHCGRAVNAAVLASGPGVMWVRCTACGAGIVVHGPRAWPGPRLGDSVEGLPEDVQAAWQEARDCSATNAHTAVEMMCRKILMHIAVDKGDSEGRSFASYIDYLVAEGYVTKPMRPSVGRIKDRANRANHDIPATTSEQASETLTFTGHLLKNVYEMEHLAREFGIQEPE